MTVGETPQTNADDTFPPDSGTVRYFQRPKPYAGVLEVTLTPNQLIAERGRSRQEMPYYGLERIRLRFTPKNSVFRAFTCDIRAKDGRSLRFDNVSWKSLIETERQDQSYVEFIRALVARASKANPKIELYAGMTVFRHTGMVVMSALMLVGLLGCTIYAALQGNMVVALLALGLTAYLGFWMKEFAIRNRPRSFTADAIPEDVLPRLSDTQNQD